MACYEVMIHFYVDSNKEHDEENVRKTIEKVLTKHIVSDRIPSVMVEQI